jgi:predicted negative regulator of RcsB-dependent stress response
MKSERRHELQHNALADWLATTYQQVQPYQNLILGVVLLLAVGMLAYRVWDWQSHARSAQAWLALDRAQPIVGSNPLGEGELERVVEHYQGSPAGNWAAISAADAELAGGASRLFSNKGLANDQLAKAVERYQGVLKTVRHAMTRERVTFSLGRALECQNKLPEAENCYKDVLKNWPDGAFTRAASLRLADIQQPVTKWFYDQFAAYNPKPAEKAKLPETLPENPPEPAKKDVAKPVTPRPATTEKPVTPEKPAPSSK